jgi:hypothetical protein
MKSLMSILKVTVYWKTFAFSGSFTTITEVGFIIVSFGLFDLYKEGHLA